MNITQEGEEMGKMRESEGLGDDIKKITRATRIDYIANTIAHIFGKDDCGCDERAKKLNEKFPYKKKKK